MNSKRNAKLPSLDPSRLLGVRLGTTAAGAKLGGQKGAPVRLDSKTGPKLGFSKS